MSERSDKPMILVPGPESEALERRTHPERRAGDRYTFTAAAEVFDLRSEARIIGRTSDLGLGGCYIDTLSPFAVGTVVRVRLENDLKEFEAMALVAYSSVPMGMGLRFTDIQAEHEAILNSWVVKLSGGKSFSPEVIATSPESETLPGAANLRSVLNELIYLMVRKKVISENEGAGLIRQMFR
jgi:hypothetical protein